MEKVLVTGATGFIGNYVINELLARNVSVIASSRDLAKAQTCNWFNRVGYIPYDLSGSRDHLDLYKMFSSPDRVIHLAWEGLPDYKSLFHFEDNLMRHYFFLKNMIENGGRNITVTGTCFEYGMKEGELHEHDVAEPDNPYGLAKHTLHKFLCELQKKTGFSLKWVRLFYMYGKGQNARSLFPQLDQALDNNEAVFNMSGGEQIRDFLPVERVAEYIVRIALQDEVCGIINCCSGQPVKLKDLVQRYLEARKKAIKLNLGYYPYPDYEPMSFWGNNQKLQTILNER